MLNFFLYIEFGEIHKRIKAVGDNIARGDFIVEVETDKVALEVEALDAGRLAEIVKDGVEEAAVGEVIAYLEQDG